MTIENGTHVRVKIVGLRAEVGEMWAIGTINEDYLGYFSQHSLVDLETVLTKMIDLCKIKWLRFEYHMKSIKTCHSHRYVAANTRRRITMKRSWNCVSQDYPEEVWTVFVRHTPVRAPCRWDLDRIQTCPLLRIGGTTVRTAMILLLPTDGAQEKKKMIVES